MLGINRLGANGKAAATSGSDGEAIFKVKLTRGKMNVKYPLLAADGTRKTVESEVDCNSVYFIACNNEWSEIPPAMKSRFHCKAIQAHDRTDGGGLKGKSQKNPHMHFNETKRNLVQRMRRNQALCARVMSLIRCGILRDVDMTAANIIFQQVLDEAAKAGMSTDDVRSYERLTYLTETVVILDAIDIIFDSELSPLDMTGRFNDEQLLLLEPYLCSNIEHAVFVLGLLKDQYENVIVQNVITNFTNKDNLFGRAREAHKNKENERLSTYLPTRIPDHSITGRPGNTVQTQFQPLTASPWKHYNEDYLIAEFPRHHTIVRVDAQNNNSNNNNGLRRNNNNNNTTTTTTTTSGFNRTYQQHELIKMLALDMHPRMEPRPTMEDLVFALDTMTTLRVSKEYTSVEEDEQGLSQIPVLEFKDNKAYLAIKAIDMLLENSIYAITTRVISRLITVPKTYVFGSMHSDRLYVWKTIVAKPHKAGQDVIVTDPNYFSQGVTTLAMKLSGVSTTAEDEDELQSSNKVAGVFSTVPGYRINGSLEHFTVTKHLQQIACTHDSLAGLPPVLPNHLLRAVLSKYQHLRLPTYQNWMSSAGSDSKKRILEMGNRCETQSISKRIALVTNIELPPEVAIDAQGQGDNYVERESSTDDDDDLLSVGSDEGLARAQKARLATTPRKMRGPASIAATTPRGEIPDADTVDIFEQLERDPEFFRRTSEDDDDEMPSLASAMVE